MQFIACCVPLVVKEAGDGQNVYDYETNHNFYACHLP
jgi:hypothetical protein